MEKIDDFFMFYIYIIYKYTIGLKFYSDYEFNIKQKKLSNADSNNSLIML